MGEIRIASPTRSAKWSAHAARQMLWLALVLALPGGAQNAPVNKPVSIPGLWSAQMPSASDPSNVQDPIQEERWQRVLNVERQKLMVSDANKLLKLARELNAEISGSNPDSHTPAQLRKVGEIEKLAHSVKEKMSTSIQGTPVFLEPPLPQMR
jgi:hypothetical protein